jgi:hypothetical protein
MSNQYIYNNYQQYSPNLTHSNMDNTSPTFNSINYISPGGSNGTSSLSTSAGSFNSSTSSSSYQSLQSSGNPNGSNYSFHTPRLRYYLSKSFDIEDDLEFCPDIPENCNSSPNIKKFNPYTASVFSPSQENQGGSPSQANAQSPRVHTPRIKKPLEIVNPQTKMRMSSPAGNTATH